jgi:hypothetical protein
MTPRTGPRIRGARKLLTTAALIMSAFLLSTSFITTLLIPPAAFQPGGPANGRALAYLAHQYLGNGFGTLYDVSTTGRHWHGGVEHLGLFIARQPGDTASTSRHEVPALRRDTVERATRRRRGSRRRRSPDAGPTPGPGPPRRRR